MVRFLPIIFLASVFSFFGIVLVFWYIDPESAPWYFFVLLTFMVFIFIWGILGTLFYFLRTRFHKRFSEKWYFNTSFKMAFFVALYILLIVVLAILQMVTTFNLALATISVSLLAAWSYLGKKLNEK